MLAFIVCQKMVKIRCKEDIKNLNPKQLKRLAKQHNINTNQNRKILIKLLIKKYFNPHVRTSSKRIRISGHNVKLITKIINKQLIFLHSDPKFLICFIHMNILFHFHP